jgi:GNAT superfamily N-acetyltransferase
VNVSKLDLPVAGFPALSCPGVSIVRADGVRDAGDVRRLVAACVGNPAGMAPFPTPAGMTAEMQSRPGREVVAWLARPEVSAEVPAGPAGLVSLVAAGGSNLPRWSISWLLVNPAWRRQRIGMSLVATAMQFAGARGASVVYVETLALWPAAAAFWGAARLAAEQHLARLHESGESRKTAEG